MTPLFPAGRVVGPASSCCRSNPGTIVKLAGTICLREGMGGCILTEKRAQRLPSVRDVENQQSVWSDGLAYPIDVLPEHCDRVRAIQRAVIEYLTGDDFPLHLTPGECDRVRGTRRSEQLWTDRCSEAAMPVLWRSYCQDYPGGGKGLGQRAPVTGARPVDLGPVPCKDGVPVHRQAARCRLPKRDLLRVLGNLVHMVTGAEAELL